MSRSAKVSVIIPTYNYGEFIGGAIESVLSQTLAPLEVIVVDDGSNDDTEARIKPFDQVRYIRKDRGGVSSARNEGVRQSRGDYVAFLDADDAWLPDKLERQLNRFSDDPEIGLVHCGLREIDAITGEKSRDYTSGAEGWVADDLVLYEGPLIVGPGSTLVVPRHVFDQVGGFDETLTHGEDWEFCVRVAKGYKVGFIGEPLVKYLEHGNNAHLDIAKMEASALMAWSKIFQDTSLARLRRRSYGNLYRILAGSFYHNREYIGFARNAAKSIWYRPSSLLQLVSGPAKTK